MANRRHDGDCFLVRGLRASKPKHLHDRYDQITNTILNEWPPPIRSPDTKEAESNLQIDGLPYYFYVMRTELIFGSVVFLFRDVFDPALPDNVYGTTPFDSGGLWHNHIRTNPEIPPPERIALFHKTQTSLSRWRTSFRDYIESNYGRIAQYIEGAAPQSGTYPIVADIPTNESRAWTWEARIPFELPSHSLELIRGFFPQQDRIRYFGWLQEQRPSDHTSIVNWMNQNVTLVPCDSTPSAIAQCALLEVCG